jgi:hypothetical protein
MVPVLLRLFRPQGPVRVAVISVEPSARGDYNINLGRGPRLDRLTDGTTYGPYKEADLEAPHAQLVASLKSEGFLASGLHALLAALRDQDSAVRARAALRLGWRRDPEAVDALLALLPNAVDDVCSILDALGWSGDTRSVPVVREYAARKLLSRRRSAVEALRNLEDEEGLEECNKRALERLPSPIRDAIELNTEQDLVHTVLADRAQLGLTIDTLYELATPLTVGAVRTVLAQIRFQQPNVWRYVKSIFKRSMLRHDFRTFGEVIHHIEAQGRTSTGTTALVKSGYDGIDRHTSIGRQKTQHFLRRMGWRYLRRLAFHRPERYPYAAAEALVPYNSKDAEPSNDLYGPYASCYLLHRIIHGNSQRLVLDEYRLLFRYANMRAMKPPPGVREEAYQELWDAEPRAYLRVLGGAQLAEAHVFAVRALSSQRMKEAVLMTADHEEIIAFLNAPYEPTVVLGLEELDRRFDAQRPDWKLIALVLADERRIVVERAKRWVTLTAPVWTRDSERIMSFLGAAHSALRPLVIELAVDQLRGLPAVRQQLALMLFQLFRQKESKPGAHEGLATLARLALLEELDRLLSLDEVLALIGSGSPAAQSVGGDLLGRRPGAVAELGLDRLTALAQHEIAAVRAASHKLLHGSIDDLRADAGPLFVLVESDWPDTRNLAFSILRDEIGFESLGMDGIIGLVDSGREDVQSIGRELVTKHFASLPAPEVINRLVQHPAPTMRPFTIDLVLKHLPDGAVPLDSLRDFCRSALFDLWPDRNVKRRVIDLLRERGLRSEDEARVAVVLLEELVRLKGKGDFERALDALVRLKLAWPALETSLHLREENIS